MGEGCEDSVELELLVDVLLFLSEVGRDVDVRHLGCVVLRADYPWGIKKCREQTGVS